MKKYNKLSNLFYPILLVAISLISHWYVLFDSNVLSYGDWPYNFLSQFASFKDYALYLTTYRLGLIMALPNSWIFYQLYYFLGLFNIGWDVGTRILFLIPMILLTPLTAYYLFKKITSNRLAAFFSACLYSFNTVFLHIQLSWPTYGFLWWILPLLLLLIIKFFETKNKINLIFISLLVFISIVYEIRIALTVLAVQILFLIFYLLFSSEKIKIRELISVFLSVCLGVLMHAFWILPFIGSQSLSANVMSNAAENLFISFYEVVDVLTLHSYMWNNNLLTQPFVRADIPNHFFIIPLISVLGIIASRRKIVKSRIKYKYLFFLFLLMISVFLAKQANPPFRDIYAWLFNNIPLFNLYRESSKFLMIVALALSFFFGLGLHHFYTILKNQSHKLAHITIGTLLFFSTIFNLQHFFTQKIGGLTKGVEIPKEYLALDSYLSKDQNFYRIAWLPAVSRWGSFSNNHPRIGIVNIINNEWLHLTNSFEPGSSYFNKIYYFLNQPFANQLLDISSIKYIIIPSDNPASRDTPFKYYGDREAYLRELSKIQFLEPANLNIRRLIIYENKNYRPKIYLTNKIESIYENIEYSDLAHFLVKPTQYNFKIDRLKEPVYINFSEKFYDNWQLRIGQFSWFKALFEKKYFLSNFFHYKNNANLNSFLLDPAYIKSNIPKDQYVFNDDGSISFQATIYYQAQSLMNLGLVFSLLILFACVIYILIYTIRRIVNFIKNEKK